MIRYDKNRLFIRVYMVLYKLYKTCLTNLTMVTLKIVVKARSFVKLTKTYKTEQTKSDLKYNFEVTWSTRNNIKCTSKQIHNPCNNI